jgi:hypothetical protein
MAKFHTTYRISEEARGLIKLLTQDLGVNQTSVIEIAVRALATQRELRPKQSIQVSKNDKISSASNA